MTIAKHYSCQFVTLNYYMFIRMSNVGMLLQKRKIFRKYGDCKFFLILFLKLKILSILRVKKCFKFIANV